MKFLNNIDLGGIAKIVNIPAPSAGGDLVTKAFVEDAVEKAFAGFDFQADVKAVQKDATLNPGTPVKGDRYIITDASALNAGFGTIAGVENGDIVEYDGSAFVVAYDVSVMGDGILVFSHADQEYNKYVGDVWSYGGLSSVTAGNGLENTEGTFSVNVDGVTLVFDGNGKIAVADDSIGKEKLNASVAGKGLEQDTDGSLKVKSNDARIAVEADGIKLVETYTKKVSANVGDGSATSVTVQHDLGTKDVIVQVFDNATFATVQVDAIRPDANSVTVQFGSAPASGAYRVVVIG